MHPDALERPLGSGCVRRIEFNETEVGDIREDKVDWEDTKTPREDVRARNSCTELQAKQSKATRKEVRQAPHLRLKLNLLRSNEASGSYTKGAGGATYGKGVTGARGMGARSGIGSAPWI